MLRPLILLTFLALCAVGIGLCTADWHRKPTTWHCAWTTDQLWECHG